MGKKAKKGKKGDQLFIDTVTSGGSKYKQVNLYSSFAHLKVECSFI